MNLEIENNLSLGIKLRSYNILRKCLGVRLQPNIEIIDERQNLKFVVTNKILSVKQKIRST